MKSFYELLEQQWPWNWVTWSLQKKLGRDVFERLVDLGVLRPTGPARTYPLRDSCVAWVNKSISPDDELPFFAYCQDGCCQKFLTAEEVAGHSVNTRKFLEVLRERLEVWGPIEYNDHVSAQHWMLGATQGKRDVFFTFGSWGLARVWKDPFVLQQRQAGRSTLILVPTVASLPVPRAPRLGEGEQIEILCLEYILPRLDGEPTSSLVPAPPSRSATKAMNTLVPTLDLPVGAQWRNLSITRLNGHAIEWSIGAEGGPLRYDQVGMASAKNEQQPKSEWRLLIELCEKGVISRAPRGDRGTRTKQVSLLREFLQTLFPLNGDPLPHVRGLGWQPEFQVRDAVPEDRADIA